MSGSVVISLAIHMIYISLLSITIFKTMSFVNFKIKIKALEAHPNYTSVYYTILNTPLVPSNAVIGFPTGFASP
jgi:hypothetical protein